MEVYGVHNIGSFSGLEDKRLWDLEKKKNKGESPVGRVAKENVSFEFHEGFKNCGGGSVLFLHHTLMVSKTVSRWREEA